MTRLKRVIVLALLLFNSCAAFAEIKVSESLCSERQEIKPGPAIKVLIKQDVITALVEVRGDYKVSSEDQTLSIGYTGKRLAVHSIYEGLMWGDEYANHTHLIIEPMDDRGFVFINGIQYKGKVHIYKTNQHYVTLINEVSIEDFLKSVLSIKVTYSMPKEALAAIAIMERTQFYERLLENYNPQCLWHVLADAECYCGYGVTRRFLGVEEAVDWTSRIILDNVPESFSWDLNAHIQQSIFDLSSLGYNARQIFESFYPEAKLLVVEEWDKEQVLG